MRCSKFAVVIGVASLVACGKPPAPAEPTEAPRLPASEAGESYTQSIGAMSDHDVDEAFKQLYPEVEDCLSKGADRMEGLSGTFTLAMRIRPDGSVKWAYFRASTLGDRAAERCVLKAASRRTWPKPVGGEGEADHTFSAESHVDVATWEERQLRGVMTSIRRTVRQCIREAPGRYQATLYIGRDGEVVSAGLAPPNPEAEAQSDCVAERLRTLKFGPQPKLTKVSFVVQ